MHKTWWGEAFFKSLADFIDEGRLRRGRAYRSDHRLIKFEMEGSKVYATVRGNINPYFGVTKEPRYKVSLKFKEISKSDWQRIIKSICNNPSWLSKLMLNEVPEDIQQAFGKANFLPSSFHDIKASCSCPDYAHPCKHMAGIYYKIASFLDSNPMLLFPLRGLQSDELHQQLKQSELGQAFAEHLSMPESVALEFDKQLFSPITHESKKKKITQAQFWNMTQWNLMDETSEQIKNEENERIGATIIKKQGDYPAFWDKTNSFVNAMEQFYTATWRKNKKVLL